MSNDDMTGHFEKRLKAARKMAGLSLEDLARKAGGIVTRQAISKYEKGRMKPGGVVLDRLAMALNVRPEFFLRAPQLDISTLHFRSHSRLSVKNEEALLHRTVDFLERYMEIEDVLGIRSAFENPLSRNSLTELGDIERAAIELRRGWGLGYSPIVNMLQLLEDKGIKVCEVEGIPGFDGLSARMGRSFVIVVNRDLPPDRIRFTAAHELGHILCAFPDECDRANLCHEFAGALLLPKTILKRRFLERRSKVTLWELQDIKQGYGISMQAVMYRARALGLISGSHFQDFRDLMKKNDWLIMEPYVYHGRERATRFKRLLHYAVAESIIPEARASALAGLTREAFRKDMQALI